MTDAGGPVAPPPAGGGPSDALDLMVVVPCHNEEKTLPEQLDALTTQQWHGQWGVTVVDNGSTDATAEIAGRYTARGVRCIRANDRQGVAHARNEGVRHTAAHAVAFCDGDDVVSPGWVAAMGDALADHPFVSGVLDPVTLNGPGAAHSRPGSSSRALPRFGSIPFGRGNNCGMHRALWVRLGGFDEDFVGLEDIELSLRAAALGVTPVLVEAAEVRYRFRVDPPSIWRQAYFYGRGRPALAREARELGLDGPSRFEGLRSWAWLVTHLRDVRSADERARLLWVLASRLGVLHGAVASRVLHV